MTQRLLTLLVVTVVFCPASVLAGLEFNRTGEPLGKLRSAFLGPDQWGSQPMSADQINAQLQQHFQVVLEILESQTSSSLDEAVALAERNAARNWASTERSRVRARLSTRRQHQINTLRRYARRSRFPKNEGYSDQAVPIFVDRHGTHCAVGYLMHCSGHDQDVERIVQQNNLVLVTEVHDGPLFDWITGSGLTQAEAALIQPAYDPPTFQATLADFDVPGTVVSGHGLTISDFSVLEASFNCLVCDLLGIDFGFDLGRSAVDLGGVAYRDPINLGLALGEGIYAPYGYGYGPLWNNNLEQWLFLGGRSGNLGGPSTGDNAIMYKLEYFVSANAGTVEEFALTSNVNFNFNFLNSADDAILVRTEISDVNRVLIDTGSISADGFGLLDNSAFMQVGEDEFFVTTYAMALGQASFTSLFHEFNIVPEPGSTAWPLNLAVLVAMIGHRKSRQRVSSSTRTLSWL